MTTFITKIFNFGDFTLIATGNKNKIWPRRYSIRIAAFNKCDDLVFVREVEEQFKENEDTELLPLLEIVASKIYKTEVYVG